MSEYTPGPWTIEPGGFGLVNVVGGDGKPVALPIGIPARSPEVEMANVRLIAAAPKLLALAKRAANEGGWHATVSPNCTCLPCEAGRAVAQVEGGGA